MPLSVLIILIIMMKQFKFSARNSNNLYIYSIIELYTYVLIGISTVSTMYESIVICMAHDVHTVNHLNTKSRHYSIS